MRFREVQAAPRSEVPAVRRAPTIKDLSIHHEGASAACAISPNGQGEAVGAPAQAGALVAKPSVLIWLDDAGEYLRAAEAAGLSSTVDLVTTPLSSDPPDALLARADAMLAWRPPARLAPRAPRLTWIQSLTGGCEQFLGPDVPATVVLTCARGTHRVQMTEHILAALFMCAKDLAGIVRDQGERRWRRRVNPTLSGATLGILGLGAIGAEIARVASLLGMRVIGTKRDARRRCRTSARPSARRDARACSPSRTTCCCCCRPPSRRRGSSTRRRWRRMKPGAFLLNFGRGDLVVDGDLVAAVSERRIAGAVLDVYTTEPLPATHAFWTTPGIVVLPHVGACTPSATRWWPPCGWRTYDGFWPVNRCGKSSTAPAAIRSVSEYRRAPRLRRDSGPSAHQRSATAWPGRSERWRGLGGHIGAPHD